MNSPKNIKAVIVDLDGTILHENQIGTGDLQTLEKLGELGIIRIINTGRSFHSFSTISTKNIPVDYLIFSAGSGIMDMKTGKILKTEVLLPEEVSEIDKKLSELKFDFQIRFQYPQEYKLIYRRFNEINPDFDYLLNFYAISSEKAGIEPVDIPAARFIITSLSENIIEPIRLNFSKYGIIRASSPIDGKSTWMEIYPKNVNKGLTLLYLLDFLKIDIKNTIGIGNDYNDIDFLDITGISYVVENAPEELKQKYKVTVANHLNPLTEIINNLILL